MQLQLPSLVSNLKPHSKKILHQYQNPFEKVIYQQLDD